MKVQTNPPGSRFLPARQLLGDTSMRRCIVLLFLFAMIVSSSAFVSAGDKKEPDKKEDKPFVIVVPPSGAKELKLVDWRFVQGTRQFSLTEAAPVKPKSKAPELPEYLEFREDKSTTYEKGILTLVPLTSIRKINYDREKKTVAVVVVTAGDKDETLAGATRFIGINKITIEADALLDGLGAATVKFNGGVDKGLHSIAFPGPKAVAAPKGPVTTIIAEDKDKSKHAAFELQPLYQVDGQHRVLPYLMFKKTVKIDLDKIASMRFVPAEDKKKASHDFEVTLKDGAKHTLTLLTKIDLSEKKSASLEGLIGRVPAGYKLFPPHTIHELYVGEPKEKLDARGPTP
jgi:hypothetical protein